MRILFLSLLVSKLCCVFLLDWPRGIFKYTRHIFDRKNKKSHTCWLNILLHFNYIQYITIFDNTKGSKSLLSYSFF